MWILVEGQKSRQKFIKVTFSRPEKLIRVSLVAGEITVVALLVQESLQIVIKYSLKIHKSNSRGRENS